MDAGGIMPHQNETEKPHLATLYAISSHSRHVGGRMQEAAFFSGATSFVLYLPADTSSLVNVSIFLFSWELVCQRTFGKVE